MSVKVRVRDFQSLGDVEIEIDGLTVVSGQNNTGKSALVRAIRSAFQNARGTGFVRHGRPKAIVDIEFGDGHTLTWEKGKGKSDKPTYVVDGGNPIHPGQGVPDEVRALGVRPINAGGREVWPQIASQFQPVFLLDQPGSVLAEAVADLDRVSQLNEALRLASSDLRSTSAELLTRRNDLATLEEELKAFDGLDDVAAEVERVEEKAAIIDRIDTALQGLQVLRARRAAAIAQVEALNPIESVNVPEAEAVDSLRNALQRLNEYSALRDALKRAKAKVASLEGVESVSVPDPSGLLEMVEEVGAIRNISRRYAKADQQVERLSRVEVAAEIELAKAERLQNALQTAKALRDQYRAAQSKVDAAELEFISAQQELDKATEELTNSLGSSCPVCGSTLQHERHS